MRAWRRHLGVRLRLHLLSGKTVEGKLCFASGDLLELQGAQVLVGDKRQDLAGTQIIPKALVELGQTID